MPAVLDDLHGDDVTQIDFHVNAPDKWAYACRLARKAYGNGASAVFHASDEDLLERFDRLLWSFSATDFIPHCRVRSPLAAVTPIHLAGAHDAEACTHHGLIVNLDREQPAYFSRFERMIEVVEAEDLDLDAGRRRWKFYKDRGYPLARHDLGASASSSASSSASPSASPLNGSA